MKKTPVTSAPSPDGIPASSPESMGKKRFSKAKALALGVAAATAMTLSSCDNGSEKETMSLREQMNERIEFAKKADGYYDLQEEYNKKVAEQEAKQALIDSGTLSQDSIRDLEYDMAVRQIEINKLDAELKGREARYMDEALKNAESDKEVGVRLNPNTTRLPNVK